MIGPYKRSKFEAEGAVARAGRRARLAGGDRQPIDPGRSRRHQADADRQADRRGGARPDAGLCRYRAQYRPCRRRRARPSARGRIRADRPALYSGRRESEPGGNPRRGRPPHRAAPARRSRSLTRRCCRSQPAPRPSRASPGASRSPRWTGCGCRRRRCFSATSRAVAELGYAPRPARQAIADAVAWFTANGYLG